MYRNFIEKILEGSKYNCKDVLGTGGFSRVFRVRDEHIGQDYAMKIIDVNCNVNNRREIELLKELKHEGLPGLHDVFICDQYTCIVMELMEGESLEEYVRRKGKLTAKETLHIGKQISEILAYLHSRPIPVIHGDLKPANIMICEGMVRLIDFGAALMQYEKNEYICGTLGYASPEQIRGELLPQSDVYSFGKIMVYMLTGRDALLFENIIKGKELKRYGVPHRLRKIILRCLSFYQEERFQSGKELSEALKKVKGMVRHFPGECITAIGMCMRSLGMLSVLVGMIRWKQQNIQDIRLVFLASVCMIILAYVLDSFSDKLYKTAILECECSLFVSEGM